MAVVYRSDFVHLSPFSHQDAIEKLNTLQSNAATLEAMRKSGQGPKAELAIAEMIEYLNRIGYSVCTTPHAKFEVELTFARSLTT